MKIKVEGMMCMHCVKSVTDALEALDYVDNVSVDLSSKTVTLDADESVRSELISVIEDLGFEAE